MRRSGEDERWREGAADRKTMERKNRRSGSTILYLPPPMYSREQEGRAQCAAATVNGMVIRGNYVTEITSCFV